MTKFIVKQQKKSALFPQIKRKMLNRTQHILKPTEEVLEYLRANKSGCQALRRRAIIYVSNGKWVLQSCVVEGISANKSVPQGEQSREYSEAVLFEDWLTSKQLCDFIEETLQGSFSLGTYFLETSTGNRQWSKERQPLSNNYMSYAGDVWTFKFHDNPNSIQGVLLAPECPYYPDLYEAVKDWLPFTTYHNHSDARKGEINLLLPETRAYFEDAVSIDCAVDLHIAGAEASNLQLKVKGAWWDEKGIQHFSVPVSDGHANLHIPENAKRLDYVLMDADGIVYDYQQEDGYRHTGLGRNRKTDKTRTLANRVLDARKNGEGQKIEFKPFIYPENSKLKEIFKTVVAFANTEGGEILIGINNEGELEGINSELGKWVNAEPDDGACDRYRSTVLTKIRDELQSDVHLDINQTTVEGKRIVIIEVAEAKEKTITFKQESTTLYVRRGSNNIKSSPGEWKKITDSPENKMGWPFR